MAKAVKDKNARPGAVSIRPKKIGKYDITVKLDMTFEEAIKLAANTPIKTSKVKKK